jgi:hypothetical protein
MSFAERRHIGYDTSIYRNPTGPGGQRIKLDLANSSQGLEDLQLQLILHMTGRVEGRGSTIRLLKVEDDRVANFYGVGVTNEKYKAPPGMKPGDRDFGILCKDSWEVPHLQDLSEGMIIQLLHVKGVRGVIWCLDEKPVLAPDAPSFPDPRVVFLDNTMYTRSRWGIRALGLATVALKALFKEEGRITKITPATSLPTSSALLPIDAEVESPSSGLMQGLASLPAKLLRKGKGNLKVKVGRGKNDKGKGKGKEKEKEKGEHPPSLPSLSTASAQSSAAPSPTSYRPIVLDNHHATRCHVRSYLYPVGTPIHWFGNILELLCVIRDLVQSKSCSVCWTMILTSGIQHTMKLVVSLQVK